MSESKDMVIHIGGVIMQGEENGMSYTRLLATVTVKQTQYLLNGWFKWCAFLLFYLLLLQQCNKCVIINRLRHKLMHAALLRLNALFLKKVSAVLGIRHERCGVLGQ